MKPSAAYGIWSTRIKECVEGALQSAEHAQERNWITNAVKGEYAHLVAAGTSVNMPATDYTPNWPKYKVFRIAASSLDHTDAVVFVAYSHKAVANQLHVLEKHMFVDDSEHNHYAAWY